ncbi:MAG: hypothetical protein ACRD8O_01195 [Bryobacteraceae bacterium]
MRIFRQAAGVAIVITLAQFAPVLLTAQSPQATLLPRDSATLYRFFFKFNSDFSDWIDGRKASIPGSSQRLDDGAARLLNLSTGDTQKVTVVSRSVVKDLDKIDQDEQAYVNGLAKREQRPDPRQLKTYRDQRDQVVLQAIGRLKVDLSAESFQRVLYFINEVHRNAYRSVSAVVRPK